MKSKKVQIAVPGGGARLAATLREAGGAPALVLAPGAGGHRDGPLLSAFASGLAARAVTTLAFDFPYRQAGRRFPDPPEVRCACYRAASAWLADRLGVTPFAGGHSMGGRTAASCATAGMPSAGLVLLGYPLYPAGRRSSREAWRIQELPAAGPGERVPLLLLTGTRDALCELEDLRAVVERFGARARVHAVSGADHSFEVLRKSGRTPAEVMRELVEVAAGWTYAIARGTGALSDGG